MKRKVTNEYILKLLKSQMIAFLLLIVVSNWGYIYFTNQIVELENEVQKLNSKLEFTKYRIRELEKGK